MKKSNSMIESDLAENLRRASSSFRADRVSFAGARARHRDVSETEYRHLRQEQITMEIIEQSIADGSHPA
ncbi:hypothetical protein [Burkholderia stabilis]|nr:hypothetical protein [Burkholderia stabilis]